MTNGDLLYRHGLTAISKVAELGVVVAVERLAITVHDEDHDHPAWYYGWKPLVERHGLEILRPRERRPPRMPNQLPGWMSARCGRPWS